MKSRGSVLTFLQLILSLLAAFLFFTLSAGFVLLGISGLFSDSAGSAASNNVSFFLWGAGLSLIGALMLPSALFALLKWTGRPYLGLKPGQRLSLGLVTLLLLVVGLPAALAIGWLASRNVWTAATVLPPMHVLAVGIPILWVALIGLRGLPAGSPQRAWGVFAAGLALGPSISLILEMIAAVAVFVVGTFVLSSNPEMAAEVQRIAELLRQSPDPSRAIELVQPLLTNPWVIAAAMFLLAVVTPLVEETFKPIGVYLLLHRRISPAEGFAAGLLNGIGFVVFESLLVTSGSQEWLATALMRAPTAVLHGFNTALVGYGLASAVSEKRYLRLAACFLAAVSLHGAWNALTLLSAGYSLQASLTSPAITPPGWVQALPLILVGMAGLAFLGIVLLNRHLRQAAST